MQEVADQLEQVHNVVKLIIITPSNSIEYRRGRGRKGDIYARPLFKPKEIV